MSPILRVTLILASIAFLAFVVVSIRRERTLLRYSLLWLVFGLLAFFAALVPGWVIALSTFFGFETSANFLLVTCVAFLMIVVFTQNAVISKQSTDIKHLVQEISLIKSAPQEAQGAEPAGVSDGASEDSSK